MNSDSKSLIFDTEFLQEVTEEVIDEETEVDYTNCNMLPIRVEQADEVAFTLDKLIKQGKIPKHGIFYKYLKGVLQVYVTPSEYSWDPKIIEFFLNSQMARWPE